VLVYAPGVILQLVDCGGIHEPCHDLVLLGALPSLLWFFFCVFYLMGVFVCGF
jgi:hypothetical protein